MVKTPSSLKQIASGLNLDHPACVYVSISKSFRKKRQTICSEIIRVEREIRREKLVYRKKKNNREQWCCSLEDFRSSIDESSSAKFRIESIELAALYSWSSFVSRRARPLAFSIRAAVTRRTSTDVELIARCTRIL